jgi:hypothetical protein
MCAFTSAWFSPEEFTESFQHLPSNRHCLILLDDLRARIVLEGGNAEAKERGEENEQLQPTQPSLTSDGAVFAYKYRRTKREMD